MLFHSLNSSTESVKGKAEEKKNSKKIEREGVFLLLSVLIQTGTNSSNSHDFS